MESFNNYLAGANTGNGFVSYFANINDPTKESYLYILKGGAGTGKSTLMKTIGKYFLARNEPIEYFYCSSDSESLDGVRLVNYNIAIVDGTSPHVVEAAMPKVSDQIVNLGDYIGPGVAANKKQIESLLKNKSNCFNKVYAYLKSAKILFDSNFKLCKYSAKELEKKLKQVLKSLELRNVEPSHWDRKLFDGYFSSKGKESILKEYQQKIVIEHNQKFNADFMQELHKNLVGKKHICFCNVLNPDIIDAIQINDVLICAHDIMQTEEVQNNNFLIEMLCKKAGESLVNAKSFHKQVEKYYIENTNFKGISKLTNKLLNQINERIK